MRISDWSSDVCSSDLLREEPPRRLVHPDVGRLRRKHDRDAQLIGVAIVEFGPGIGVEFGEAAEEFENFGFRRRSEELTSALQSLMRISSAVFCLTRQMIA